MSLSFIPLGVGDAFSQKYYSSCYAVECEGHWLLVDCPHPIRKILSESGGLAGLKLDLSDFDGVVLTHLHGDHVSGLEGWAFFNTFMLKKRTQLLGHPEALEHLWSACLLAGMGNLMDSPEGPKATRQFEDYFDLTDLSFEHATSFGPFEIECRKTIHHVPTTALRIRAGGRCLGFSADTAWDPSLIEWLSAADLIVHETNYGIHTPYERLVALAPALQKKMRLVHYPDDFALEASVIEPLRQGQRVVV